MERKLVAGYDMQKEYAQLSFYIEGMKDAESVSFSGMEGGYEIPYTIVGTDRLLERVVNQEIDVLGKASAEDLLEKFLLETLQKIPGVEMVARQIDAVAVSMWEQNSRILDAVFRCLERLGIRENRIYALSEQESAACYALSREKELWMHDILYLDFSREHFLYRRLHREQDLDDIIAHMEEREYSELFSIDSLLEEQGRKEMDEKLLGLVSELLDGKQVSCIYLVGEGFCQKESWMTKSIKYICSKRRVFLGMNLYTKGASIHAYDKIAGRVMESIVMRLEGCIPVSIGLRVVCKGENRLLNLVKEGNNWYRTRVCVEVILDECRDVTLLMTRQGVPGKAEKTISLAELPYRDRRMTRVELTISFLSPCQAMFQATDLGFGQYAESSGVVVRKMLDFSNTADMDAEMQNKAEGEVEELVSRGRLLLCSSKRSRYPYETGEEHQNLFSIEEFCYYLYHNSYLIQKENFNEKLIAFIRNNLEMELLAVKLENCRKNDAALEEFVMAVMQSAGYYEAAELTDLKEKLSAFGAMKKEERLKVIGDMYQVEGKLMEAQCQYYMLLKMERSSDMPKEFFGAVYHNMGILYMNMFFFQEAAGYLKQAYGRDPQEEYRKKLLFLYRLSGLQEKYAALKEELPSALVEEWEMQWQKQKVEAKQMEENGVAAQALQLWENGETGQFQELAEKQLEEWKEEYRYEME